MINKLHSPDSV